MKYRLCELKMFRLLIICLFLFLWLSGCSQRFVNQSEYPKNNLKNNVVKKQVFLHVPKLGSVGGIVVTNGNGRTSENELTVMGENGALVIKDNGKELVEFTKSIGRFDALSEIREGGPSYISRVHPPAVYDYRGRQLWSYHPEGQFMGMAYGDVDGNGYLEFIVASNDWILPNSTQDTLGGKLELFDHGGTRLWSKAIQEVWHVEIADIDDDSSAEIIYSDYSGRLTIRDGKGIAKSVYPHLIGRNFSLCKWPDENSPDRFLVSKSEMIVIYDLKGTILARLPAPGAHQYEVRGIPIMVENNKNYFAVIVKERASVKKANLYIFSNNNKLIHQEVIPVMIPVLFAFPPNVEGSLLIGGEGIVWLYKIKG